MQRSIFLVEDESALRSLLATHLRKRGHRVLEAGDAEGAVRHLVQEPPFDLLITDVHLPTLSGLDLLRLLQGHSPMKPVLVITGDDDSAIAAEAISRGAAGYLLKPFELSELDAAVAQALRHLELVERAGELDPIPSPASILGIPIEWLEVADAHSGAEVGHSRRVERLATVLARRSELEGVDTLAAAARLHEVGQLVVSGEPESEVPALSAKILQHVAVEPSIRSLIAGMSGSRATVGPGTAIDLATVLVLADQIDHRAMERVQQGVFPPMAIMEALDDVLDDVAGGPGGQAGAALAGAQEVLSAMWILSRGGYPPMRAGGRADAPPSEARGGAAISTHWNMRIGLPS